MSNLDRPISFEEVHSILSNTCDSDSIKIPFEIISIRPEINSFIVAARIKSPRSIHSSIFISTHVNQLTEQLERNGVLIRHELEDFFPKECISSLQEDLVKAWPENKSPCHDDKESSSVSKFVSGMFETIGLGGWYQGSKDKDAGEGNYEEVQKGRKRCRI